WLHGAIAKNLKADVELALTSAQTGFPGYEPFCFDDPVRSFGSEAQSVFNGTLNDKGISKFHTSVLKSSASPGMLTANFRTRVFEPGGGFSIDHFNIPFHPYNRYVGVKLPEGDKARGMLLTDTDHITDIVMVNEKGMPVPFGKAAIEIYKIKWRWWWEKGSEVIADYVGTSSYQKVSEGIVDIVNGRAQWHFMIKYPSWGRYLIRVTDVSDQGSSIEKDTHIAGKIFYADWPGWAGRGGKESPEGASVLNFSSDKETYRVGEDVTLTIPAALTGRALVSLESGSNILLAQWIEAKNQDIKFTFTATPQMAPNIYAAVTLVQPYSHPGNDLPVRRYGVIPIPIVNPDSRLKPVIQCSDEFKPETDVTIKILEQSGEPMTYTLAVVDDGLLGLTRFATPDPWEDFYAKQALGIKTWDLFDSVAGAYGGALEKILAIGGDDAFGTKGKKRSNRFPPMVRFIGPFELAPNGVNAHTLSIPQYIGQVRVMAVAGHEEAFGSAQKEVKVKAPLMVQGTLPRVVATLETVDLPISVFCLDDQIKTVKVIVKPMGRIAVENEDQMSLVFKEIGDKIISFKIKAGSTPGPAGIIIEAFSGSIRATQRIDFNIRSPLVRQVQTLDPGPFKAGKLRTQIDLPGIPGTAKALLEVSRIPPINLGKRLDSLIQYPHGCAEQVISQLFPQLFLKSFLSLSLEKEKEIEQNIKAGIDRIIAFQKIDGGFAYWPLNDEADPFVTSYAGHFLLLAEKLGYLISGNVLTQWKHWQAKQAHAWMTGHKSGELMQAYRLFTLAVANDVQLGAMNRLRESGHLSDVAKTRLAAAYQLAGQPEAAFDLTQDISMEMDEYLAPGSTYGNEIRDKAMILESLLIVNKKQALGPIMDEISEILASDKWLSTQSTAYCLIAMAQAYDLLNENQVTSFSYAWNKNQMIHMESKAPVVQILLPQTKDNRATLVMAAAPEQPIFLRIMVDSIPLMGQQESSASGIFMTVAYSTLNGLAIDPEILTHGTDLTARVSIKNIGTTGTYKDLALTYRVPSGWEIINKRLDFLDAKNSKFDHLDFRDDRVNTYFDLKPGQTKTFSLELNASYLGRFFLPATIVEAMYDASINAVEKGRWVNIVKDTTRQ
ncbi:MAG: hypothetical protein KJ668_09655, partial [Proteobacteria bacterium]|nr:hypothetical protein [Pseudomonadota bacterium]